jgi:predicted AlkP superfamily phosphohydrolase/phosphomutase
LSQALYQLKDARTGTPMVKNIIRTRQALDTCSPDKLPDADLVIIWQDEHITDTVESPDVGRIGPVPYHRTGSHRSDGFVMVQGSAISHESIQSAGHALDLAPTILEMMGASIPQHMEGNPLVKRAALIP